MNREMKKGVGVKDIEAVAVEPGEFVNLTYDSGFKIVFGTEGKSERLLMTLLNRVLGMKIVSVKYLPTERLGLTEEESRSFFDVYCKDTGRELGDDTNIIFIDLQKFRKDFDECEDMCEKWLYSIRNMHLLKERPAGVEGTELEELYDEAHYAAWSADKRSLYERYIMNKNDYENILCEHYEDGFAAGRVEGREEGREEGLVSAARNMKIQGLPLDMIMAVTGLSEEACEAL